MTLSGLMMICTLTTGRMQGPYGRWRSLNVPYDIIWREEIALITVTQRGVWKGGRVYLDLSYIHPMPYFKCQSSNQYLGLLY